jgi:hypothetical protein
VYIDNKLGAFLILLGIGFIVWIFTILSERNIIKEDSRIEAIIQVVVGLFVVVGFFLVIYLVLSIVVELWFDYKVKQWW